MVQVRCTSVHWLTLQLGHPGNNWAAEGDGEGVGTASPSETSLLPVVKAAEPTAELDKSTVRATASASHHRFAQLVLPHLAALEVPSLFMLPETAQISAALSANATGRAASHSSCTGADCSHLWQCLWFHLLASVCFSVSDAALCSASQRQTTWQVHFWQKPHQATHLSSLGVPFVNVPIIYSKS